MIYFCKNWNILLTLGYLIVLMCSCQNMRKESTGVEKLSPVDSFNLNLDEFGVPEFNFHQVVYYGGEECLVNLNFVKNSLDFYSLKNGLMVHRIDFSSNSENFGDINGFYFLNEDSIFLFPKMTFTNTKLINFQGEILKNYRPENYSGLEIPGIINHFSNSLNPTYYRNNSFYFERGILENTSVPGVLNESYNSSGRLDLNFGSLYLFDDSGFPSYYFGKAFPIYVSVPSRILNSDNQFVYSWNALDSILIYDKDMKRMESVFSKSEFKVSDFPQIPNASFQEEMEAVVSNTYYCKILYDPNREKYYRFVQIGRRFDDSRDNNISSLFKNDFSVIIHNDKFQFESEIFFKGGIYNFYHAFVGERGLYLPKTNPYFNELNEDYVVFDIYEF